VSDGVALLPATVIEDPAWLAEQVRLRGLIWGIEDRRVLAVLWWYSASSRLVEPLIAGLVRTGTGLSGRLEEIVLHHRPCSRFAGSHATAVGGSDLDALGAQLAETCERTIAALEPFTGTRRRPLWAIGADAIAGRLLWAGREAVCVEAATALAAPLAQAIGPRLPRPRYVEVPQRSVARVSCCLIYRVPGEPRCSDCPAGLRARRAARPARPGKAYRAEQGRASEQDRGGV
jgi:ferric iron reductase protein FhuF